LTDFTAPEDDASDAVKSRVDISVSFIVVKL